MLDGGRLIERLCAKLPPSWEPDMRLFQGYINDIFGGFFRAQLTVAGIYALLTWLTTWAVLAVDSSVPGAGGGAFLAALLAGIFMMLPFLGAFLAVVPPVLLLVIQTPPDLLILKLVILVLLLGAWQHVVLNVLAPRIYGHHLGMDPIILFAALLLGAKEGGIWGAFFAAPIVAIGYAILETFYDRLMRTHPAFLPEGATTDESASDDRAQFTAAGDAEAISGQPSASERQTVRRQPTPHADGQANGEPGFESARDGRARSDGKYGRAPAPSTESTDTPAPARTAHAESGPRPSGDRATSSKRPAGPRPR